MNLISTPFNGAYFRIRPQSYAENTTFPLMRFELYGCRRSVDIDVAGINISQLISFYSFDVFYRIVFLLLHDVVALFYSV